MARNLYLIRHGQVESRFKGKLVGSTDAELSPAGLEQAVRLNNFLSRKSPDISFSSPMRRCLQTAEQAVASLNIEIVQEEMFCEVDFGEWERVDKLTMPHWALGRLMDPAVELAGKTGTKKPEVSKKSVVVMRV